jgi:Yip1 domain
MKNPFLEYYQGIILKPQSTFETLIKDINLLKFGFYAVLIPAILYTFVYVFLIFGCGQPFKPWLDIPLETYYRFNVFFCAPSMFLGWILATGVVHTVSRLVTREGTFEQTLSVLGFGISVASWTTGIHDVVTSFLGAVHIIDQHGYELALNSPTIWRTLLWIQMAAYLIWFMILFSKGVRSVYSLKLWQAATLGTIGFFTYQLFFLIFNR